MKKQTGKDFVRAIERLLLQQSRDAQETKQALSLKLIGEFARQNGVPLQSGAVGTITKALRKLDGESVRQVRSLSDRLLNKDDRELVRDLESLRENFLPIEARIHQVKTRAAFVAAALRPFSPRHRALLLRERQDIDVKEVSQAIENLALVEIADLESFTHWTKQVADLFDRLVIYRGPDASDYYTRPAGTVTQRSSRTYLQAWLSFTDKFKSEIWSIAQSGEVQEKYDFKLSRSSDLKSLHKVNEALETASVHNVTSFSPTPKAEASAAQRASSRALAPLIGGGITQEPQRISVKIQSKVDPSAEAIRSWIGRQDFEETLDKWLEGIALVWGSLAGELTAKVSVGDSASESSVALPGFSLVDASEKIRLAAIFQLQ
jgi:hypothetical protein